MSEQLQGQIDVLTERIYVLDKQLQEQIDDLRERVQSLEDLMGELEALVGDLAEVQAEITALDEAAARPTGGEKKGYQWRAIAKDCDHGTVKFPVTAPNIIAAANAAQTFKEQQNEVWESCFEVVRLERLA